MQVLKEKIRDKILDVAKDKFLSNGFTGTTMESIAKEVGITAPNLYRYFKNKDDILAALVKPVLERWENAFNRFYSNLSQASRTNANYERYSKETLEDESVFVDAHRDEYKLLFFCASGSKYENFSRDVAEKIAEANERLMFEMKKRTPNIKTLSPILLRVTASMKLELYREIVRRSVPQEELRELFMSLSLLTLKGWEGYAGVKESGLIVKGL